MSFLKKHWRFTVPAVAMLCVLLLGMVLLYSAMVYIPDEDAKRYSEYVSASREWNEKERLLLLESHDSILEADEVIRSLGEFNSYQDVIDRFTSMTPEEASARERFWKSWDLRNKDLAYREDELSRTKPIEPIAAHKH